MKLLRIGAFGAEKPAVLVDDDSYVDLSDVVLDFDEAFFAPGGIGTIRPIVAQRIERGEVERTRRPAHRRPHRPAAPDPVHRPELPRPRRRDRPGGAGRADPVHQVAEHPGRPERRRPHPARLDQDRLGGRARHRHRQAHQLPRHGRAGRATRIAGWTLVNDVSERAFQMERGGQWSRASPPRRSTPPGPGWSPRTRSPTSSTSACGWTSTACAARPASTSTMIFDPYFIVHYLSQFMVLEPGDLINTGTPPGVGMGFRPRDLAAGRRRHGARHRRPRRPAPERDRATMRAFVVTAPGEAGVEDVADAVAAAGPGRRRRQARRRLRHRHRVLHRRDGIPARRATPSSPCGSATSGCGVVTAVGDGVDPSWIGRRVTGDTMVGCGKCYRCLDGRHHVCENRFEIGIRGGLPGRAGRAARLPAAYLHALPDAVERRRRRAGRAGRQRAAFGVGRRPLTGRPRPRSSVPATIGLLVAQFARAAGAEVHLMGRSRPVARLRANASASTTPGPRTTLPELPWDAVIDASNASTFPHRRSSSSNPANGSSTSGSPEAPA